MSAVYLYASQLLLSDYSVKINAERIFSVIGNGKKRYTEIEDKLEVKKTGNLSKQIKSLIDLEIIARNSPINKIETIKSLLLKSTTICCGFTLLLSTRTPVPCRSWG